MNAQEVKQRLYDMGVAPRMAVRPYDLGTRNECFRDRLGR